MIALGAEETSRAQVALNVLRPGAFLGPRPGDERQELGTETGAVGECGDTLAIVKTLQRAGNGDPQARGIGVATEFVLDQARFHFLREQLCDALRR